MKQGYDKNAFFGFFDSSSKTDTALKYFKNFHSSWVNYMKMWKYENVMKRLNFCQYFVKIGENYILLISDMPF